MNELINDEAVYKTAPATPGLLKMEGEEEGLKWLGKSTASYLRVKSFCTLM